MNKDLTSNERLEGIKERVNYHGHLDDDVEWLIEQAERVQELERQLKVSNSVHADDRKLLNRRKKQNKRYRKALEEIIHQKHLKENNVFGYDHEDISSYVESVAREALEE